MRSLREHLAAKCGGTGTPAFQASQRAFVESLAAYSLVCYLLQIKDRWAGLGGNFGAMSRAVGLECSAAGLECSAVGLAWHASNRFLAGCGAVESLPSGQPAAGQGQVSCCCCCCCCCVRTALLTTRAQPPAAHLPVMLWPAISDCRPLLNVFSAGTTATSCWMTRATSYTSTLASCSGGPQLAAAVLLAAAPGRRGFLPAAAPGRNRRTEQPRLPAQSPPSLHLGKQPRRTAHCSVPCPRAATPPAASTLSLLPSSSLESCWRCDYNDCHTAS